jgi:hypothetical protein
VPNRQPAEYRHSEFAELAYNTSIADHFPRAGFARANELAHRNSLHAIKASRSPKLGQRAIDPTNKGIDSFDQENRILETGTSPSHAESTCNRRTNTRG